MYPEVKLITINIETPDGKLPPAKVRVRDVPTRLASLVPSMHQLCNGIVGLAIRREESFGSIITCRAGCGVCCHQLVPISAPEAFFLRDYLNSLTPERRVRTEERFSKIEDIMKSAGLIERLMNLEKTQEHEAIARDYFHLKMQCPFLEENSCSIYQYRPFACREYNVVSPSDLCADPFSNPIQKIKIPMNMTTATARLAAELYGLPPMLIPMTFALQWVEENKVLAHKTWSGVWLFNLMMEYATGTNPQDLKEEEIEN